MSNISPDYVLKQSAEAVNDLNFCTFTSGQLKHLNLLLASNGNSGGVDIWNLKTRRPISKVENSTPVLSCFGLGESTAVTLDKEGHLRVVNLACSPPEITTSLCLSNIGFCKASVEVRKDGHIFVSVPGEEKSCCNIWDLTQRKLLHRLIPPSTLGMLMCIKMFWRQGVVFVGYEDGSILCWHLKKEIIIGKADKFFTEPVMCFDIVTDDEHTFTGLCGSATDQLIKWNVTFSENHSDRDIRNIEIIKTVKLVNDGLASCKIRPDKKIFATGGWDYKVRIFSWKTLKPLAVLEYHTGTIQSLAFSNFKDGAENVLACGSTDHKISVWKIYP